MQVILTISQIMWCRDLTECLEREDGDHLEALEAFEKVNFEVRLRRVTSSIALCQMVPVAFIGVVNANSLLQKL